jgi:pseudaminic acid cytidylyltransferase
MSNLALIPARGGSKRIPGKNIKDFLGQPIIAYSIIAALKSGLFDEVMVSTDDGEIARIALLNGASVPFMRSSQNSTDYSSTIDVIEEVIKCYDDKDLHFENVCCIYPTAPFVTATRLKEAFSVLTNNDYDSIFPVVPFSYPVFRGLKINSGVVQMVWPEYANYRSQDIETIYHDAGQFYMARTDKILSKRALWTDRTGTIILSELEVQDIDNETDWKLAELKYKLYLNI